MGEVESVVRVAGRIEPTGITPDQTLSEARNALAA